MAGFSLPQFQFSYNGEPAAGGSVYVYKTGTTTTVPLYSDSALTQPVANPVTLDVNGMCSFYVGSTVNLRMDAYTANNTFIETVDPVFVIPDLTTLSASVSSGSGGFVNKFRNGAMDIWQRGISGTITAGTPAYTADGWIAGSTGANITWACAAENNNGCSYYLQLTGASSVTDAFIKQRIEGVIAEQLLSGGNVTIQAQIYNNTGAALTPALTVKHATALDNWGATVTDISGSPMQTIAPGGNGQVAYTFAPNNSSGNGLEITIDFGAALNSNAKTIGIFALDIRVTPGVNGGINNTPPTPELRPYPAELAICQRYLQAYGDVAGDVGQGAAPTTSVCVISIPLKTTMRAAPTLSVTTAGDFELVSFANTNTAAASSFSLNTTYTSNQSVNFAVNVSGTPLTASAAYHLSANTALAGNLLFSAEL